MQLVQQLNNQKIVTDNMLEEFSEITKSEVNSFFQSAIKASINSLISNQSSLLGEDLAKQMLQLQTNTCVDTRAIVEVQLADLLSILRDKFIEQINSCEFEFNVTSIFYEDSGKIADIGVKYSVTLQSELQQ